VPTPELDPATAAAGEALAALAAAQEASPVFDPLAFEEAAALLGPLLPAGSAAQDALARLLGIGPRLADDWLRETLALLGTGDQADAAVRDKGTRRIAVLALAWGRGG
jgi:predicted flap endonuclease-1-like 5' DNA nuclease